MLLPVSFAPSPPQPLLERLFAGFKLPDSSENEYLMRCVMRVIGFVGPAIAPVSAVCLQVGRRALDMKPGGTERQALYGCAEQGVDRVEKTSRCAGAYGWQHTPNPLPTPDVHPLHQSSPNDRILIDA